MSTGPGGRALRDCLICRQIAELESLPGGAVVDGSLVVAYHVPPIDRVPRQYLGRILVVTRRHVDRLGELTREEASAVGLAARQVAGALECVDQVERVHSAIIGLGVPHFHQHVFPRYAWMPRDADWNALHELSGAPLGEAVQIQDFVATLRPFLRARAS